MDSNPDANQTARPNLGLLWIRLRLSPGMNPATGWTQGAAQINCFALVGPYPFTSTGVVASVVFIPVRQGTTTLSLSDVVLGDDNGKGNTGSCNPIIGVATTCGTASISV